MKALLCVAIHDAVTRATRQAPDGELTEDALFRMRARSLARRRNPGLTGRLWAMLPTPLAARLAAYSDERALKNHIKRLENVSGHLLDDVGIQTVGRRDYVVRTDDMDAVRASRHREAADVSRRERQILRSGAAMFNR